MAEAMRKNNYAATVPIQHQIKQQELLLKEISDVEKYNLIDQNMDKHKKQCILKLLALSLNEADLSLMHLDMFFAHFKEHGFTSTPEWRRLKQDFAVTVTNFSNYTNIMFRGTEKEALLDNLC